MKNVALLFLLFLFSQACTFQRKAKHTAVSVSNPTSYDGTYANTIGNCESIWSLLTNKKDNPSGTILIRTLDKKNLVLYLCDSTGQIDSVRIKGKLANDVFQFKKRTLIHGWFPLFWELDRSLFSLGPDLKGKPALHHSGKTYCFFIVAMVMASDGKYTLVLKKTTP